MKHSEIKNLVLFELDDIKNMAIKDSEQQSGIKFSDYCHEKNALTPAKKAAAEIDFIFYCRADLPENWTLKYEQLEISFPTDYVPTIHLNIKNQWGTGKTKQPVKAKKHLNARCKELQNQVAEYRSKFIGEYQNTSWGEKSRTQVKNEVLKLHKKADASDIIKLWWKFITNPAKVEGINTPWKEEPKALFTPYSECDFTPETVKNKYHKLAS